MDYGGLNAKVRALKGRLLKYEDYYALCRTQSVEALGRKLLAYPEYEKAIASISVMKDYRRAILERKLDLSIASEFIRLYNFIPDHNIKKYLYGLTLQEDIALIKFLLCNVYDHRSAPYSPGEMHSLLKSHRGLDMERLLAAKTPGAFIAALSGSEFYEVLQYVHEDMGLFDIEMRLDLYYYMQLWKIKKTRLKGRNKQIMDSINGTEIDIQNLLWLYRLKKYYGLENTQIYSYLIPIQHRLTSEEISGILYAKNEPDLLAQMNKTVYGPVLSGLERKEDAFNIIISRLYKKSAVMHPDSIGETASYLFHKKVEIKNLVSLMEGIRYSLRPEKIMAYLFVAGGSE